MGWRPLLFSGCSRFLKLMLISQRETALFVLYMDIEEFFGIATLDSSTSIVCHETKGLGRRRTYRFEEVLRLLHSCLLAFPKPFQHCYDFFYMVFHLL